MDPDLLDNAVSEIKSIVVAFESFESFLEILMHLTSRLRLAVHTIIPAGYQIPKRFEYAMFLFKRCMENDRDAFYLSLVNVLQRSSSNENKHKAANLLRRLFRDDKRVIEESTLLSVQAQLFVSVKTEEEATLHDELSMTIAEVGKRFGWTQFFPLFFECVHSDDPKMQLAGLSITSHVSMSDHLILVPHSKSLLSFFLKTLPAHTSPNLHIRMASLHAVASFTSRLAGNDTDRYDIIFNEFEDLLPYVMDALNDAMDSGQDVSWLKLVFERLLRAETRFFGSVLLDEVNVLFQSFLFSVSLDDKSMEILHPENLDPIAALLSETKSPEIDIRRRAEKHIQNLTKNCTNLFVHQLCKVITGFSDLDTKLVSVNLLIRDLGDIWPLLSPHCHYAFKQNLLLCLDKNQDETIFNRLCQLITEISVNLDQIQPEIFPLISNWFRPNSPKHQEWGLHLLSCLFPVIVITHEPTLDMMNSVFSQCLSSSSDLSIRIKCFCVMADFIKWLSSHLEKYEFRNLIQAMMKTLMDALILESYDFVYTGLLTFDDFIEFELDFVRSEVDVVFHTMLHIAEKQSYRADVGLSLQHNRRLAIKILLVLAEAGLLKETSHDLTGKVLAVLINMWLEAEFGVDTGRHVYQEVTRFACSSSMMDGRLAPAADMIFYQCFVSTDWRMRTTGISALVKVSKGYSLVELDYVMGMLLNALRDDHFYVRMETLQTIRELHVQFGPDFKARFCDQISTALEAARNDQNAIIRILAENTMQLFRE